MGYIIDKAKTLKSNIINIASEQTGSKILSVESVFNEWHEDVYTIGDIRRKDGQLWKCCQGHDSRINTDIIPNNSPAHWVAYHATDKEYAKPFIHPTGAHDVYMNGEFCIYTDDKIYESIIDNNTYSPDEYSTGWKLVN